MIAGNKEREILKVESIHKFKTDDCSMSCPYCHQTKTLADFNGHVEDCKIQHEVLRRSKQLKATIVISVLIVVVTVLRIIYS